MDGSRCEQCRRWEGGGRREEGGGVLEESEMPPGRCCSLVSSLFSNAGLEHEVEVIRSQEVTDIPSSFTLSSSSSFPGYGWPLFPQPYPFPFLSCACCPLLLLLLHYHHHHHPRSFSSSPSSFLPLLASISSPTFQLTSPLAFVSSPLAPPRRAIEGREAEDEGGARSEEPSLLDNSETASWYNEPQHEYLLFGDDDEEEETKRGLALCFSSFRPDRCIGSGNSQEDVVILSGRRSLKEEEEGSARQPEEEGGREEEEEQEQEQEERRQKQEQENEEEAKKVKEVKATARATPSARPPSSRPPQFLSSQQDRQPGLSHRLIPASTSAFPPLLSSSLS
eukprot:731197-Hanusia_phi.AAC.1